jgi:hypothetical protein
MFRRSTSPSPGVGWPVASPRLAKALKHPDRKRSVGAVVLQRCAFCPRAKEWIFDQQTETVMLRCSFFASDR